MPVLSSIGAWLLKTFGIAGCCIVLLLFYYEGIPGASKLKFPEAWPIIGAFGINNVPIIGDLTTGKVHAYAADQVNIATAQQTAIFNAKLEKLVSGAELAAANARSAEMERQRNAASQALTEATKRQAVDDAAQIAKDAQTDIEIADYEKKLAAANRRCLADPADVQFLQSH